VTARRSGVERRRRRPTQARAEATVDFVLEAAARVFKREGFAATTNRIAAEAGVSIGTIYEYFPHKQALLLALAERHVALAEAEIRTACDAGGTPRELLVALQKAILASQRFPSQALDLIEQEAGGPALQARAATLRQTVLETLANRAAHLSHPALRARAAFGAIGELSARTWYELDDPQEHARLAAYLVEMAVVALQGAV
jgi:AcrR family transcriptional regulator